MAVLESGEAAVFATIEAKHLAIRMSGRPLDVGTRGAYSAAFVTGVLPAALGANSEIFQWRFQSVAGFLCLLRSVKISAAVSTTAFAAGVPIGLAMTLATGWTVAGTGGTGITWGANDGKKRSDFATTILTAGDVRIATTAALGAGTKTLHAVNARHIIGQVGAVITSIIPPATTLWLRDTFDEYPFLFEHQEGFVIRSVEVPATGTWKCAVEIEWAEIDPSVITGWS
jgi:hypothetical protein